MSVVVRCESVAKIARVRSVLNSWLDAENENLVPPVEAIGRWEDTELDLLAVDSMVEENFLATYEGYSITEIPRHSVLLAQAVESVKECRPKGPLETDDLLLLIDLARTQCRNSPNFRASYISAYTAKCFEMLGA